LNLDARAPGLPYPSVPAIVTSRSRTSSTPPVPAPGVRRRGLGAPQASRGPQRPRAGGSAHKHPNCTTPPSVTDARGCRETSPGPFLGVITFFPAYLREIRGVQG
jgi:hypothetical protein